MTRPVTVYEWWRPEDSKYNFHFEKREVGAGKFIQFGLNCEETETSIATYTSAIVEMPDGHVLNIDVGMIRFDDVGGDA